MIGTCNASPWFKCLWKSCCKSRLKFFFWLIIRDRLNTRNLLRRKNRHLDSYDCVLCSCAQEETLLHILFECQFSQQCWRYLGIHSNSKIFREVFMVGC
ncbi:hypothetical protein PR202_gb24492 [Eleusine coracana subsp. coracana]|uniref:Reverse transcriptase zinc-binding domain-containing protein n=1 Tax=Eleusine coracana subsp. coracana TaxID=191504 RepID=A0AAV5FLM0_ELECO|nr:hypothetical protein PR202_gb24492 [Eleusine coracana subsp. coracana]